MKKQHTFEINNAPQSPVYVDATVEIETIDEDITEADIEEITIAKIYVTPTAHGPVDNIEITRFIKEIGALDLIDEQLTDIVISNIDDFHPTELTND